MGFENKDIVCIVYTKKEAVPKFRDGLLEDAKMIETLISSRTSAACFLYL